ncbi:MAG: toprim domain-containing protein [Dialister invisus]
MAIQITITVKDKKKRSSAGEKLFTRKPNAKGKHLIIVESPAKAKTIERILGSIIRCLPHGHLRDLPQRTLAWMWKMTSPEYVNSAERADVIENLQKEANKSKDILLATDPDREGEAISWHLSKLLDVDPRSNARIAFHEITPPAIKEAVLHPEPIDLNRVDAQQARRVLDRLVGYKLSPWLWKQVYRGLSAGRTVGGDTSDL